MRFSFLRYAPKRRRATDASGLAIDLVRVTLAPCAGSNALLAAFRKPICGQRIAARKGSHYAAPAGTFAPAIGRPRVGALGNRSSPVSRRSVRCNCTPGIWRPRHCWFFPLPWRGCWEILSPESNPSKRRSTAVISFARRSLRCFCSMISEKAAFARIRHPALGIRASAGELPGITQSVVVERRHFVDRTALGKTRMRPFLFLTTPTGPLHALWSGIASCPAMVQIFGRVGRPATDRGRDAP